MSAAVVPRRLAAALLLLPLLAAAAGCTRKTSFVPASADSSLAMRRDSLSERVRALQQSWSAGGQGEEAARLTAAVLLADLRARQAADPGASWEERARALLDSLDVGAEFAGGRDALIVNFFARGDPLSGSWPWAYWCPPGAGGGVGSLRAQALESQGMSLAAATSRGLPDPVDPGAAVVPGAPGIAALFSRRGGAGQQPIVMVWRAGARLDLAQTLGPDSLGGVGTGAFETQGDSVVLLTARTWRPTPRFDECATCPHVFHLRRFRWGLEGFHGVSDEVVPAPYVTFVRFIQALGQGDRDGAERCVAQPSLVESAWQNGLAGAKGPWRAAPGSEERADEMVFYRGSSEAWKVAFTRRGPDWLILSFEPATRVIE
jgi:hypothetical protein